jgi:hypothetical protein
MTDHEKMIARELPPFWDDFIQRLCEMEDRTSPDDQPDCIIASPKELAGCFVAAKEQHEERHACEHGVWDGDYCEQCNAEYKRARAENGSNP